MVSKSFTKTNQKWPRLDWKRIYGICGIMFDEPVFMTREDSEAFEKSSSLFQGFSEVFLTSRCVEEIKTLICGLEMSKYSHESGKDSVKINLSRSDS